MNQHLQLGACVSVTKYLPPLSRRYRNIFYEDVGASQWSSVTV